MTYQNLFTILTPGPDALRGLDGAIALATAMDAHLDVLAIGVEAVPGGYAYAELNAAVVQATMDASRQQANDLKADAQAQIERAGLARASVMSVVCSAGLLPATVRRLARFSDLAIQPSPYAGSAGPEEPGILETALFEAHIPVLVLPKGFQSWQPPRRIAVAWNEGAEALRAVRYALPLIRAADTTYLSIIDPPQHGPDRSDPGGLLAQYLARHGARCEVDVLARSLPRISDHLLRTITERDIDVMVMGAYGRARWSEAMFGGATRDMLRECPVPVLMAH